MPNLYGVANSPGLPIISNTISGADVACPSSSTTAFITTAPLIAPSGGYFYALIIVQLHILTGATTPGGILLNCNIAGGSNVNAVGIPQAVLPISNDYYTCIATFSAVSQVAWQGAGSVVNINATPLGQAITVKTTNTSSMVVLLRAPDQ